MKIPNFLLNFFNKKEIECEQDEHCPIYLSYLGEYGKNDKIKHCKNPNKHFCKKHNLIDQTAWNKMSTEEKIKLVKDMDLIKYIHKD